MIKKITGLGALHKKGFYLSTPLKLILYGIVLVILVIIFNNVVKSQQKIMQCAQLGGRCTTGTCNFVTELPYLADKAVGCGSNEICCIPITQNNLGDASCSGKKEGDICASTATGLGKYVKVCDASSLCVTLCQYCSNHPTASQCKVKSGKSFVSGYSCVTKIASSSCLYIKNNAYYAPAIIPTLAGYCYSDSDYCCMQQ